VNATTAANLLASMNGEAFDYTKFMLYADRARLQGHQQLAALFENAAKQERFEHFVEGAGLAGLVRSDEDNLRNAVGSESSEVEKRYRDFAERAFAVGDDAAGAHFEECGRAEIRRREAFRAALSKLESNALRAW